MKNTVIVPLLCNTKGKIKIKLENLTLSLKSSERQKAIFILMQTNEVNSVLTDRWRDGQLKTGQTLKPNWRWLMLVRTLSTDTNNTVILVTSSECTLTHKATDTVLTYKTARPMVPEPVNRQTWPTNRQSWRKHIFHVKVCFIWRIARRAFLFQHRISSITMDWFQRKPSKQTRRQAERQTARQAERQTEERNVYQINVKLKTFRHRQRKLCMRLMDIAADVTSSLKFKHNDLTSFSSHIMTLRHMVAMAET